MELGKLICAGVDVWLNTPQKPREASGTSGMKAALNGSFFNAQRMMYQYLKNAYADK